MEAHRIDAAMVFATGAFTQAPRRAFGVQIRKAVPMPRMPPSAIPTATVGCSRRSRSGSLEGRTHEPLNGKLTDILLEALCTVTLHKRELWARSLANSEVFESVAAVEAHT